MLDIDELSVGVGPTAAGQKHPCGRFAGTVSGVQQEINNGRTVIKVSVQTALGICTVKVNDFTQQELQNASHNQKAKETLQWRMGLVKGYLAALGVATDDALRQTRWRDVLNYFGTPIQNAKCRVHVFTQKNNPQYTEVNFIPVSQEADEFIDTTYPNGAPAVQPAMAQPAMQPPNGQSNGGMQPGVQQYQPAQPGPNTNLGDVPF
jgi:hypothetical protein